MKISGRILLCSIALAALFSVGLIWGTQAYRDDPWREILGTRSQQYAGQPFSYIAHAGGGLRSGTPSGRDLNYTNSLDALDRSYRAGFRLFEIDFMYTRDQKIVCIHDWRDGFLSFEEFHERKNKGARLMELQNCDIQSLGQFFASHADAVLILDTKEKTASKIFFEATKILSDSFSVGKDRIIPQAYSRDDVKAFKAFGFERVIFTLYKLKEFREVASACSENGVAITFPVDWIVGPKKREGFENSLGAACPLFIHTVNRDDVLAKAMKIVPGISGIYTDYIDPVDNSRH